MTTELRTNPYAGRYEETRTHQVDSGVAVKDAAGSEVLGLGGLFDWGKRDGVKGQTLTAYRFYFTDCFDSPAWLVVCNGSDVKHLEDALEVWIEHLRDTSPGCLIQPEAEKDYIDEETGEIEGIDFGPSGEMLDSESWGVDEVRFDYAPFTIGECSKCGKVGPECGMTEAYGESKWWGIWCSEACRLQG